MAEQFFKLGAIDQKEIINSLSSQIGLTPQVIEKDIWVCWVLDKLFSMVVHLFPKARQKEG